MICHLHVFDGSSNEKELWSNINLTWLGVHDQFVSVIWEICFKEISLKQERLIKAASASQFNRPMASMNSVIIMQIPSFKKRQT